MTYLMDVLTTHYNRGINGQLKLVFIYRLKSSLSNITLLFESKLMTDNDQVTILSLLYVLICF